MCMSMSMRTGRRFDSSRTRFAHIGAAVAAHGADAAATGRHHALEARIAAAVALGEGVERLLTDALGQRLRAAGVPTLNALLAQIARRQT